MPATRKIPKNNSEFCIRVATSLPVDCRRHHRHRPDRDRHRDQIGQDRHRAAQQPGVEAGDDWRQSIRHRRPHRSCSWTQVSGISNDRVAGIAVNKSSLRSRTIVCIERTRASAPVYSTSVKKSFSQWATDSAEVTRFRVHRRHPEVPRILRGVSKDGRKRRARCHLFEARRSGELAQDDAPSVLLNSPASPP